MTGPGSASTTAPSPGREQRVSPSQSYADLRAKVEAALDALEPEGPVTTVRLVRDLGEPIQRLVARGGGYADIARVLELHGVRTSSDAVRMALRRTGVPKPLRPGGAPASETERAMRADARSQATIPDPEVSAQLDDGVDVSSTTPRQAAIGRHLV